MGTITKMGTCVAILDYEDDYLDFDPSGLSEDRVGITELVAEAARFKGDLFRKPVCFRVRIVVEATELNEEEAAQWRAKE